jgi:hypothetical protein
MYVLTIHKRYIFLIFFHQINLIYNCGDYGRNGIIIS